MSTSTPCKVTVLLSREEFSVFEAYCCDRGFKKSTLIARLIREHLAREDFGMRRDARRGELARPQDEE